MKFATFLHTSLLLVLVLGAANPPSARAQEAVLESYSIGHGGNQAPPGGLVAGLTDRSFGNGTAKALIQFAGGEDSSTLSMLVWRWVRRGEVVPALLVFRIEVRGLDAAGAVVYSRDLKDFSFGDSRSGFWTRDLDDLPPDIAQIKVTFFGNYE